MELRKFLSEKFDKKNFIQFLTERFYGLSQYNDTDNGYLGKVKLDDKSEIGFFIFQVEDSKDIENTRVSFQKELKKSAEEYFFDGAIGAFYNTIQKSWRLSFIRFTYNEEHKREVTSQKRFTFLLGNDKTKTAYEQLKSLKYPTIVELEKAFSVEAVTKEFYKGLVKEYEKLLNEYLIYPSNDDNSKKEFAIRLIGRILFIKFLNKKSLVPDNIFEVSDGYYHEKLEPLFFEQLNTPKLERKKEFVNDSIPFLNGGLFEPLHLDYYEWSGFSSKYINMFKIDDRFFVELYEHLNQYNFTIDENSIEDSDLAIDPEMLGRIFENLLAEINPETSQNARKSTGSYYTPREIVEYMVSSSLLEYLKTKTDADEEVLKSIIFKNQEPQNDYDKAKVLSAIFELKILDPACGSGAFPMGLLQKIVKILNLIDEDAIIWFGLQSKEFRETHKNRNKDYIRKLSIIKNTIYGIDIQPIAIEISKLRFFLSLIVDEDEEPEPLPNLEFKFVCANSLLPKPKNTQLASLEYFMLEADLLKLKNEYFEASGERKKAIKKEYIITQKKMFEEEEATNLLSALENKLTDYNPFDPVSITGFFDSDFMFNIKDGFDIVIGNPPYIRQELIKDLKPKLQQAKYKSYNGTADIYIYFFEQGHKLLKNNGVLSFITSNKYTRAKYGKEFREFVLNNTNILEYIDFNGVKVFESATVDTSILSFKKTVIANEMKQSKFLYCDITSEYKKGENLKDFCDLYGMDYIQSDLTTQSFTFANPQELKIKQKIEAIGTPLKEWDININYGIKTGFNEAFIIDTAKRDELVAKDPKSAEIIKPILRGRDIKRYGYEWADKWLIGTFPSLNLNIENFSAIQEFLYGFYPKLKQTGEKITDYEKQQVIEHAYRHGIEITFSDDEKSRKKTTNKWFETQDQIAYWQEFEKEKIIYPNMASDFVACFDNMKYYINQKCFSITGKNLKYLTALLNSKTNSYYFKQIGAKLGDSGYEMSKIFIEQIPIPKISKPEQESFVKLVDEILELKKEGKDTTKLEVQIDKMVYKLYGLTDDEIKVVEGNSEI